MDGVVIFGDTVRSPELRHEVPLPAPDPMIYVERDGTRLAFASSLEVPRLAELDGLSAEEFEALGADELVAAGKRRGYPTQLTKRPGEVLADGFYHSLGHGVGLEVHERPILGRNGEELVAGDVVAIEPGCYRRDFGGCPPRGSGARHRGRLRASHRRSVRPRRVTS